MSDIAVNIQISNFSNAIQLFTSFLNFLCDLRELVKRTMVSEEVKVAILVKMREATAVLFGELSPTLTFEVKEKQWKEILGYGKSVGLIKPDKDYKYFRDKMYGQW